MVVVDDSCLKEADSQPKSGGLVWGLAAAWHCSTLTRWTEWTLAMTSVMMTALQISSWLLLLVFLLLLLLLTTLIFSSRFPGQTTIHPPDYISQLLSHMSVSTHCLWMTATRTATIGICGINVTDKYFLILKDIWRMKNLPESLQFHCLTLFTTAFCVWYGSSCMCPYVLPFLLPHFFLFYFFYHIMVNKDEQNNIR